MPKVVNCSSSENSELEVAGAQLDHNLNTTSDIRSQKETKKSRKIKRNFGREYITSKGKTVNERQMKMLTPCIRKCSEKITKEEQKLIFDEYWKIGEYNLRRAYVSGCIEIHTKKTALNIKHATTPRNRPYTYKYFLKISNKRQQVCQQCFKKTIDESDKFIKNTIKKMIESSSFTTPADSRGKSIPKNKISEEKCNDIINHIKSFPLYESHYSRQRSSQMYFETGLNLSIMYKLYCKERDNPVSITKYTEIFKTLNIKFKKPKIDTCNTCDIFQMKIKTSSGDELEKVQKEQAEHHRIADFGYESKRIDINATKQDNKSVVFVFDLQQVLPTPYLTSNLSYYKRHLSVYNLTIHDCKSGIPHCYMWHEGMAGRGANEVSSCLFKHLSCLKTGCSSVILYSDNCFGQNKNSIVATMMAVVARNISEIEIIDHKFLEVGHTHLECDSDHSLIEKKKKRSGIQIHHPREWYQFVRTVGTKKQFEVHEMDQDDIKDFKLISKQKFSFRKADEEGNKIIWKNIKWLRYTSTFGKVYYKNSLDINEPFKTIKITKRGINDTTYDDVSVLKDIKSTISATKKKDLIDLLPLIDSQYHPFYLNLPVNNRAENVHPDFIEEYEEDI